MKVEYYSMTPEIGYFLRRLRYMLFKPAKYLRFWKLRKGQVGEYTLAPFEKHRCIFIHIPKCAGQSIRESLFTNLYPGHISAETFQKIFPRSDFYNYFKFTFVRNPWDRLVSSYFFLSSGGAHEIDKKWSQKNLLQYSSFELFVKEGLRNTHILNFPHFKPQVHYLRGYDGKIQIDFLGYVESLQKDYEVVKEFLGIKAPLKFLNVNRERKKNYWEYYSQETKRIVSEIYQEDISTFDYGFMPKE